MNGFDNVIHQPVRLRIMSSLSTLEPDDSVDFTYLKKVAQPHGWKSGIAPRQA